jgi:hypothetical protein
MSTEYSPEREELAPGGASNDARTYMIFQSWDTQECGSNIACAVPESAARSSKEKSVATVLMSSIGKLYGRLKVLHSRRIRKRDRVSASNTPYFVTYAITGKMPRCRITHPTKELTATSSKSNLQFSQDIRHYWHRARSNRLDLKFTGAGTMRGSCHHRYERCRMSSRKYHSSVAA